MHACIHTYIHTHTHTQNTGVYDLHVATRKNVWYFNVFTIWPAIVGLEVQI